MATATVTIRPINNNWKVLHHRQFAFAEDAVRRRDTALLAAMRFHEQLHGIDSKATLNGQTVFLKGSDGEEAAAFPTDADGERARLAVELAKRLRDTNDGIQGGCERIRDTMGELANSKSPEERWKKILNTRFQDLEFSTMSKIRSIRDWSLNRIEEMDNNNQVWAAKEVSSGVLSSCTFLTNALSWLQEAMDSIWKWLAKALQKVVQFAAEIVTWYNAAKRVVDALTTVAALAGVILVASDPTGVDQTSGSGNFAES